MCNWEASWQHGRVLDIADSLGRATVAESEIAVNGNGPTCNTFLSNIKFVADPLLTSLPASMLQMFLAVLERFQDALQVKHPFGVQIFSLVLGYVLVFRSNMALSRSQRRLGDEAEPIRGLWRVFGKVFET